MPQIDCKPCELIANLVKLVVSNSSDGSEKCDTEQCNLCISSPHGLFGGMNHCQQINKIYL